MKREPETQLRVFQLLMESDQPLSFGEISRRLHITKSLAYHHVRRLVQQGALLEIREDGNVRYDAQPIFLDDLEETLHLLEKLSEKLVDPSPAKLAFCIRIILEANQ